MCAPHPSAGPFVPLAETSTLARWSWRRDAPALGAGPRPPCPCPRQPPRPLGCPLSSALHPPSCRELFISSPGKTSPHPFLSPFPRSSPKVTFSRHVSCVRRDPGATRTGYDTNPEVRFPEVAEGPTRCQPLDVREPGCQPPVTSREATSPRRGTPDLWATSPGEGCSVPSSACTRWGPGGGSPPCQALPEAPREGGSNSIQQMTGPRPGVQWWARGRVAVPRAHGDRAPTPRRALLGTKWAEGPQEQGCGQGGQGAEGSHATHIPSVTLTPSRAEAPEPNDANRGPVPCSGPARCLAPGRRPPPPPPRARGCCRALSPGPGRPPTRGSTPPPFCDDFVLTAFGVQNGRPRGPGRLPCCCDRLHHEQAAGPARHGRTGFF